ncbi:glycosyl transferase [Vibrio fluvialis]|nr:glycosyl transferase [Vibrio fluvialis]
MYKTIIKFARKFNKSSNIINKVDRLLDVKIKSNQLLTLALTSEDAITQPLVKSETELVVSLTTYNKRIHDVHLVIESIALQTVKPNRVVLWLDEDEFSLNTIPLILKKQMSRGLEIYFCPNYRSYKKLIPTLQRYPNANVITIDDDVLYPHDMVEMLCREHSQYPDCIIGHRVHKIKLDASGDVRSYVEWEHETLDSEASFKSIAIGIGGIFYPSGVLGEECLNIDNFTKFAPSADDIWFKAMSLLMNKKHKKVKDDRVFNDRFLSIESSQDIALVSANLTEDGNDPQIESTFKHYSVIEKLKD